mgnify:CR=1
MAQRDQSVGRSKARFREVRETLQLARRDFDRRIRSITAQLHDNRGLLGRMSHDDFIRYKHQLAQQAEIH